jgi:hypothetical protein
MELEEASFVCKAYARLYLDELLLEVFFFSLSSSNEGRLAHSHVILPILFPPF